MTLSEIALLQKKSRLKGIGLMSGTSLDGLDIGYYELWWDEDGRFQFRQIDAVTVDYPAILHRSLKAVTSKSQVDSATFTLMNRRWSQFAAEEVERFLKRQEHTEQKPDFVASHGHTFFHLPSLACDDNLAATFQLGTGAFIAKKLNCPVIYDLRQDEIAGGREGAPIAPYLDLLLTNPAIDHPVIYLNLGGISNFTIVENNDGKMTQKATDCGPANKLIDLGMEKHFGQPFDEDGEVARNGTLDAEFLVEMKSDPFFAADFPKSTGPEYFNWKWVVGKMNERALHPRDIIHTLAMLTVLSIRDAVLKMSTGDNRGKMYVSGGGARNSFLLEKLNESLPEIDVVKSDQIGVKSDDKETLLIAALGFVRLTEPESFPEDVIPRLGSLAW